MDRLVEKEMQDITIERAKNIYRNAKSIKDELFNIVDISGEGEYFYNTNKTEVRWCKNDRGYVLLLSKGYQAEILEYKESLNTPKHYDNTNGTLYKISDQRGWNSYLFDIVKRLERAEKKGEFTQDLEKSINVIKLWQNER